MCFVLKRGTQAMDQSHKKTNISCNSATERLDKLASASQPQKMSTQNRQKDSQLTNASLLISGQNDSGIGQ